MMNYRVVEGSNFTVVETATDLIIKTYKTLREAKSFMRHLNLGGGFDGFTPEFILKKVDYKPKKNKKVL